jgi:hypothetical protein
MILETLSNFLGMKFIILKIVIDVIEAKINIDIMTNAVIRLPEAMAKTKVIILEGVKTKAP